MSSKDIDPDFFWDICRVYFCLVTFDQQRFMDNLLHLLTAEKDSTDQTVGGCKSILGKRKYLEKNKKRLKHRGIKVFYVENFIHICDPCEYLPMDFDSMKICYDSFWYLAAKPGFWTTCIIQRNDPLRVNDPDGSQSDQIVAYHTSFPISQVLKKVSCWVYRLGVSTEQCKYNKKILV